MFIEEFDGLSNLLKPGVIEAALKASGAAIVGIMIDSDEDVTGRFRLIRERCKSQFPNLPEAIPSSGVIQKK